jgi:hypothetical protein
MQITKQRELSLIEISALLTVYVSSPRFQPQHQTLLLPALRLA